MSGSPYQGGGARSQQDGLAGTLGIDNDVVAKVRGITSKIEDLIDSTTQPLKPYLPAIARSVGTSSLLAASPSPSLCPLGVLTSCSSGSSS